MVTFGSLRLYDPVLLRNKQYGIVVGKHQSINRTYITVSTYLQAYNGYSVKNVDLEEIVCRVTRDCYNVNADPNYKFERRKKNEKETN